MLEIHQLTHLQKINRPIEKCGHDALPEIHKCSDTISSSYKKHFISKKAEFSNLSVQIVYKSDNMLIGERQSRILQSRNMYIYLSKICQSRISQSRPVSWVEELLQSVPTTKSAATKRSGYKVHLPAAICTSYKTCSAIKRVNISCTYPFIRIVHRE